VPADTIRNTLVLVGSAPVELVHVFDLQPKLALHRAGQNYILPSRLPLSRLSFLRPPFPLMLAAFFSISV